MAKKDLAFGQRTIRRILKELEQPEELEHEYAAAILAQARSNASGKPTPQARMAAENLTVEGASIVPLAGGAPAEVAIGSEFGSIFYPQFHRPSNQAGYWLYPATRDTRVLDEVEKALDDTLNQIVNRPI